jgi:glycosyltransferase involved in cell wall biosynthesis
MANGAAVVASPNVGAEWVLSGGAAGVLAYDENLSDALVSVLTDDVRRLQLQAAGHARAMDFSWTAVGNQHEEAYEHVVAVFGARQEI